MQDGGNAVGELHCLYKVYETVGKAFGTCVGKRLGKGEENGIVTVQRLFYNVVALTLCGVFVEESNL